MPRVCYPRMQFFASRNCTVLQCPADRCGCMQVSPRVTSIEELLNAFQSPSSLTDPVYLGVFLSRRERRRRPGGGRVFWDLIAAGQAVHGGVIHLCGVYVLRCTGVGVHFNGTEFQGKATPCPSTSTLYEVMFDCFGRLKSRDGGERWSCAMTM